MTAVSTATILPAAMRFNRFVLIALLFLQGVLTGCGTKERVGTQAVFRINLSSGLLESLDPAYARDLYTMWAVHALYNTLVETDSALRIVPSLAKRWTVSEDGLTYTFHLRNDVYFHDNPLFPGGKGRKLTATDAAFSFARLIDPALASPGAWIFHNRVENVRPFSAIDDTTLEIKLSAPFRPLPGLLTMPYCSVVPREIVEKQGAEFRQHPCGTGPFRLQIWDEGSTLILHRNPNYWEKDEHGEKLPYLHAVAFSFYDSKATEFLLFMQKKLDFVNGVDGSFKDLVLSKNGRLREDFAERYDLTKKIFLNSEYIGFRQDSAANKEQAERQRLVRQAICFAIDRPRIGRYFRNGIGIPATGGFIPPGLPGGTLGTGYTFDPKKSAALLSQAGYPGGKGLAPVVILTPDNWSDIVNVIVSQLAEVGIAARTEIVQPNLLRQQMSEGKAQAFRAQWIADYPDAETYLVVFEGHQPAPPNYTRYRNPLFDSLYRVSVAQPDSQRWATYRVMDSLVTADAPVIPLFYDQLLHFTQKNVVGFSSNPMNLIDLKRVRKDPAR